MAKYQNKRGGVLIFDGKNIDPNGYFEMSDEKAESPAMARGIKLGLVVRAGKGGNTPPASKETEGDSKPAVAYRDLPEATAEQIVLAVAALKLDDNDQFTKVGGIKVAALESILQEQIGTATRTSKDAIAEATKSDKNPNGADRVTLRADAEDAKNAGKGGDNNG